MGAVSRGMLFDLDSCIKDILRTEEDVESLKLMLDLVRVRRISMPGVEVTIERASSWREGGQTEISKSERRFVYEMKFAL